MTGIYHRGPGDTRLCSRDCLDKFKADNDFCVICREIIAKSKGVETTDGPVCSERCNRLVDEGIICAECGETKVTCDEAYWLRGEAYCTRQCAKGGMTDSDSESETEEDEVKPTPCDICGLPGSAQELRDRCDKKVCFKCSTLPKDRKDCPECHRINKFAVTGLEVCYMHQYEEYYESTKGRVAKRKRGQSKSKDKSSKRQKKGATES